MERSSNSGDISRYPLERVCIRVRTPQLTSHRIRSIGSASGASKFAFLISALASCTFGVATPASLHPSFPSSIPSRTSLHLSPSAILSSSSSSSPLSLASWSPASTKRCFENFVTGAEAVPDGGERAAVERWLQEEAQADSEEAIASAATIGAEADEDGHTAAAALELEPPAVVDTSAVSGDTPKVVADALLDPAAAAVATTSEAPAALDFTLGEEATGDSTAQPAEGVGDAALDADTDGRRGAKEESSNAPAGGGRAASSGGAEDRQGQNGSSADAGEDAPRDEPASATDSRPNVSSEILSDPRIGKCDEEELWAVHSYFDANWDACPAYRCLETETEKFLEELKNVYPNDYTEEEAKQIAGMFAACTCRCDLMKCEIDFFEEKGSEKCRQATREYCYDSNEKFVNRCVNAAKKLPVLYNLQEDSKRFRQPCSVCTAPSRDVFLSETRRPLPQNPDASNGEAAGDSSGAAGAVQGLGGVQTDREDNSSALARLSRSLFIVFSLSITSIALGVS